MGAGRCGTGCSSPAPAASSTSRAAPSPARAGHEPLLIAHPGASKASASQIEILTPAGFPLGILGNAEFRDGQEVQQVPLAPGDRALLFTDGVTEAMDARGEEFGMQRILYAWGQPDAEPALDHALEKHIGQEPLSDDLTLIAIAGRES